MDDDPRPSRFKQYFDEIIDVINNKDHDLSLFREILDDLFESYVKDQVFYVKIGELYLETYEAGKDDYLFALIEKYQAEKFDEEIIPVLSVLFTYKFPIDLFRLVIEKLDPEYFDIVLGLFSYPDEDGIDRAVNNLDILYPQIDADTIQKLLDRLDEVNAITTVPNVRLRDYLSNILVEINEFAPIPDWVIRSTNIADHETVPENIKLLYDQGMLPSEAELQALLPPTPKPAPYISEGAKKDTDYLYSLVVKGLKNLQAEPSAPNYDEVYQGLAKLQNREREDKINWFHKNQSELELMNHPECQRILGASFPIAENINRDSDSKDPCSRYGGCRSSVCYENHNFDDDTGEMIIVDVVDVGRLGEIDWFTGSCQNCKKRIRKRCHATRTVLESGGWYLCFCSWKCVKDDLPENQPLRLHLIGVFEHIYNVFGVYDRKE